MKLVLIFLLSITIFSSEAATWKKIVAGSSVQVCPDNYIFVPALAGYTTLDFCVAKYEMKNDGYGMPISQASGTPWVSIDRPTARAKCKALGVGFDMISNDQWQSIARNIAGVASNWSGGSVGGTGQLNRGHSDGVPNNALAAVTDDNDSCNGTGETCSSTVWSDQRRTHTLSNGNVIWDLAGNVQEWVTNDSNVSNGANAYISTINDGLLRQTRFGAASGTICTSSGSSPYCGMGQGLFAYTAGGIFRGGDWASGVPTGIFAVSLNTATSVGTTSKGFRCVFIP